MISKFSLTEKIIKVYTMYKQGDDSMIVQVKTWGNSQGIRLSKELDKSIILILQILPMPFKVISIIKKACSDQRAA